MALPLIALIGISALEITGYLSGGMLAGWGISKLFGSKLKVTLKRSAKDPNMAVAVDKHGVVHARVRMSAQRLLKAGKVPEFEVEADIENEAFYASARTEFERFFQSELSYAKAVAEAEAEAKAKVKAAAEAEVQARAQAAATASEPDLNKRDEAVATTLATFKKELLDAIAKLGKKQAA